MQRWIVLGVVAMVLAAGGAALGYRAYKQSRPHPVWVPMPVNPELTGEKRDELAKDLKVKLGTSEKLTQISKDLNLTKEWALASDAAAADELKRRLFVNSGEMAGKMGMIPSINVGVSGKEKERIISEKIAMRLMDDVWDILGIEPPKRKGP